MSDPRDNPKHDPTVFAPAPSQAPRKPAVEDEWFSGGSQPAAAEWPAAAPPAQPAADDWAAQPASDDWAAPRDAEEQTLAGLKNPAPPEPRPASATAFGAAPSPSVSSPPPANPPGAAGRIREGATLNASYRITRWIADGGMGVVYEAIELITTNRVAIKVIRPELAGNPSYRDLLVKEAQTLSQLFHPGLAHYRMCSYDKEYDALYIVMDFVEGPPLSTELNTLKPGTADLIKLVKRLASALQAAHEAGVIHRDISPDNIILSPGGLDQAMLIDFGIAKDLGGGGKTIIGEGFAGKIRYVAPEQFALGGAAGDGKRPLIGAWTDIYSLGLVILTIGLGRPPPMGDSILDAVERRKTVPDVSSVPKTLQPLVKSMLAPDSAKRPQSMADVVAELDRLSGGADTKAGGKSRRALIVPLGAIAGAAVGALALIFVVFGSGNKAQPPLATQPPALPANANEVVSAAVEKVACTWVDAAAAASQPEAVDVRLQGLSGNPDQLTSDVQLAVARGIPTPGGAPGMHANVNRAELFRVSPTACGVLQAFRRVRETGTATPSLAVPAHEFLLDNDLKLCAPAPGNGAPLRQAKVSLDIAAPPGRDFTLVALEPSGRLQQFIPDRATLEGLGDKNVQKHPDGTYRLSFCVDEETARATPDGLAAMVLVNGKGPFTLGVATDHPADVPATWPARFSDLANTNAWTTQMAWFRVH